MVRRLPKDSPEPPANCVHSRVEPRPSQLPNIPLDKASPPASVALISQLDAEPDRSHVSSVVGSELRILWIVPADDTWYVISWEPTPPELSDWSVIETRLPLDEAERAKSIATTPVM